MGHTLSTLLYSQFLLCTKLSLRPSRPCPCSSHCLEQPSISSSLANFSSDSILNVTSSGKLFLIPPLALFISYLSALIDWEFHGGRNQVCAIRCCHSEWEALPSLGSPPRPSRGEHVLSGLPCPNIAYSESSLSEDRSVSPTGQ